MATDFAYLMVKVGANIADLQSGLNTARGAVTNFGTAGKNMADNWVAKNGAMTKAVGRNMLIMGTAITAFTGLAIKSFAEMEQSMANVSTMLDAQTMYLLPGYERGMRDMAEATGDSLTSLTKGMYDLLSAMIEPTEAMGVLEIASKTAVAGMTSTAVAVDGMTTVLNSYGLEAKDAGSVSDWFFTIVKRGKTTFDELAPAIGQVAPIASSAGVSLDEMGAMLALLTRNGVKTDIAVTSLKAVITAFGSAGNEATEIAKELGFEMSASALKQNGLAWAMKNVNKATDDQMAVLVGNVRAKLATSVATANLTQLEEDLMAMQNRSGTMMVAYTKNNETLNMEMKRLGATFKNVKDEAIARIIPEFTVLISKTQDTLKSFRDWGRENEDLATTLMKIVGAGGPTLIFLGLFLTQLPSIVTAIGLVMSGLTGFIAFMTGPWGAIMIASVIAINKVTKAWIDASVAEAKAGQARKNLADQSVSATDIMINTLEELKTAHEDLTDEELNAIKSKQHWIRGVQEGIEALKADGKVTKEGEKAIFEWTLAQNLSTRELVASINNRQRKTTAVKESTKAVESETDAIAKVVSQMTAESQKVSELKKQYTDLNTQLKEGTITKEQYAERMNGLIDVFSGIEGGAKKVLDIMAEIDETDPNIAIKFEVFGMEQFEDTQLRIRAINQDIVLEKLEGDARQIQSTKFELENFLFVIDRKIEAEKIKNNQIIADLQANLEAQTKMQLSRLQISKEITQAQYDIEIKALNDKFAIDKGIIDETQRKNFSAYEEEKAKFTEKTNIILEKLEEKRRKQGEVANDAVKKVDKEGRAVEALGREYDDLNKSAGAKRGTELGTVTKATMQNFGEVLSNLIRPTGLSTSTAKSTSSTYVRAPSTPAPTLSAGFNKGNIYTAPSPSSVGGSGSTVKTTLKSGFAKGTDFVPATGEYTLHKGEAVIPAEKNNISGGGGVTILNVFKEEMIPEIMAKYPGAIINMISSDIANHGITKKVIMGAIRNA